jgi:O-antigen/teichoic acid export membrane protein
LKYLGFKDEFIKQTGLVFIGMGLFNLFNLLYHLFMIRYLPPMEYGHLNALIALFTVISVPAGTVQTTVTRFFSSFKVQNQYHQAIELLRHFLIVMSIIALSFFLLIIFASSHISSFLQISSRGLVILFGLSLVFSMVIPILWGGLQGLQKFGLLTLSLVINSGLKLALGILFVFLGFGLLGAMSAIAVSYIVTTILSLFIIGVSLPKEKTVANHGVIPKSSLPSNLSEVYHYSFSAGLVLLCFMVLTNIDLILVKHFFTPIEAGYYSIAQMVGKIILILPIPIVTVMFPNLFSLEGQEKRTLSILGKNLGIAVFLCGGAVIFSFLFPSLIVKILSGKVYLECLPLVGIFSVNMTLFSLTLILLYYHLSTLKRWFLYPLFFFTLIEIGLIILFHDTLIQVLMIVGIVAFCLSVINLYMAYRPYQGERKKGFT